MGFASLQVSCCACSPAGPYATQLFNSHGSHAWLCSPGTPLLPSLQRCTASSSQGVQGHGLAGEMQSGAVWLVEEKVRGWIGGRGMGRRNGWNGTTHRAKHQLAQAPSVGGWELAACERLAITHVCFKTAQRIAFLHLHQEKKPVRP